MQWELDHVFLACPEVAAARMELSDFGLSLVEGRVHRGQGTANICAFFENAFFELLYPQDDDELRSDIVAPLGLKERIAWVETGACPVGICFRPTEPMIRQEMPPVAQWAYAPAYVARGATIPIVTPRDSVFEPLIFLSTHSRSACDTPSADRRHRGARRTLTHAEVRHPARYRVSAGVQWFADNSALSLVSGPEYRLDLVWDDGAEANRKEFESLPLGISW